MENLKSASAAGLGSSVEWFPPREPGYRFAAHLDLYGPAAFVHDPPSPPREVKPRVSYGGGFQMPRKEASSPGHLQQSPRTASQISARYSSQIENQPSISNFEQELMKLKMESQYLSNQWFSKPIDPSILHVDPITHSHKSYYKAADATNLSLEELELMKESQTKKLIDLETEYYRTKQTSSFQHPSQSSGINFSYSRSSPKASYDYFTPKGKPTSQSVRLSPTREQYEAKYERYLQGKAMNKKNKDIRGKPKINSKEIKKGQTSDREFEMVTFLRWMFKKLDKDGSGSVDTVELMQEFHANPEIAEMFGLREQAEHPQYMERFKDVFDSIGLGNKHEFTLDDFLEFFRKRQEKPTVKKTPIKRPKSPKKNIETAEPPADPVCLLTNKQMQILEEVFFNRDEYEDKVLKRYDFIDALKQDERVIKILHVDAIKLGPFQTLNLETMLNFIENDGDGPEEFITWNQFLEYFFTKPQMAASDTGITDPRLDDIDIPPRYVSMIKEFFDQLPTKGRNKVSTYEFISGARKDYKIKGFLSMTAREPDGLSLIPPESVNDVLTRMERDAGALVSWTDILGYFSKRGIPKLIIDDDNPNKPIEKEKFAKLTMPKTKVQEIAAQTDEIPENKSKTDIKRKHTRSLSPQPKEFNRTFNDIDDFRESRIYQKDYPVRSSSVGKFGVTVPEPFGFETRELTKEKSIRQRRFEEYINEIRLEEERHLNMKYKANPIPSDVIIPKYDSILAAQEARRIEVKRTSMETTKANEKPFSFYVRDKEKKKPEPVEMKKETFKANPVPWHCKVSIYDQMRNQDKAAREERIARAAQESLRKSSLPPRMEMHEKARSQQIITPKTENFESFKAKDPPNFTKLQAKFQKTLDMNKNAKLPTQVMPFNFDKREGLTATQEDQMKREKLKTIHPEVLDEIDGANFKWGNMDKKDINSSTGVLKKPKVEPSITEKVRDMISLRKKKIEESEEKVKKLKKEEDERKAKQDAIRSRVQNSHAIQEKLRKEKEDRDKRTTEKLETMNNQSAIYKAQIKEMNERVSQRPLLVETVSDNQLKNIAKMKTLLRVKRSLEESKIPIANYFNEEEKDLIEEAEYLVKINKLAL
ncbi:unnamed protein product [Blepharisma stoltei]|uniref:EF-hand domain-containing protein n=1 Tax=Blepharisma stoltei TaxID=1481888 RepID=A0AAU9J7L2_9CILI|nr:unnamed protein product [Blepharisma stoltei]